MGTPVTISYGASWSYLEAPEGHYPGLIPCIREALSVYVDTAIFAPSFEEGRWDGFIHFMTEGGRFASGLLPQVMEICQSVGFDPTIKGLPEPRECPQEPPKLLTLPQLCQESPWWFQWLATKEILKKGRGVVKIPTAGGKTQVAAMLVKVLVGERVLFLLDQIELLDQTADRFESLLGEPIGKIGGGSHELPPDCRICIATVQTLAEKKDKTTKATLTPLWPSNKTLPTQWLMGVTTLILDECHLATSTGFYEVTQAFKKAHRRIGLSATPFDRGDLNTAKLVACCGEEIYTIPARVLIDLGVLAEPNIYMIAYDSVSDRQFEHNSLLEYDGVYEAFIYSNTQRNNALITVLQDRSQVLVLVTRKSKHGVVLQRLLSEAFPEKTVVYVSGDSARHSRRKNRSDFLSGDIDILIATGIYDKGVDLPNIETLVLAGGGKNQVNTIQRLGRGMRGAVKSTVDVFDFFDTPCEYILEHTLARYDIYAQEGYNVQIVQTDQLHTLFA